MGCLERSVRRVGGGGLLLMHRASYQEHFWYKKLIEEVKTGIHNSLLLCMWRLFATDKQSWQLMKLLLNVFDLPCQPLAQAEEGIACSMQRTGRMHATLHFTQSSSIYTIYHISTYSFRGKDNSQNKQHSRMHSSLHCTAKYIKSYPILNAHLACSFYIQISN